jgi:hypothetical protein
MAVDVRHAGSEHNRLRSPVALSRPSSCAAWRHDVENWISWDAICFQTPTFFAEWRTVAGLDSAFRGRACGQPYVLAVAGLLPWLCGRPAGWRGSMRSASETEAQVFFPKSSDVTRFLNAKKAIKKGDVA